MGKEAPESRIYQLLSARQKTLSTAESLTGGMIGSIITSVPGVSSVYCGGVITYSNEEKHQLVSVSTKTLKKYGAVSKKCAKEMAEGCAKLFSSDCSIAVTGNAGPTGSEDKPVGLVYIGLCVDGEVSAKKYRFEGDRESIRRQTAEEALSLLLAALKEKGGKKAKASGKKQDKKAGRKEKKEKKASVPEKAHAETSAPETSAPETSVPETPAADTPAET